MMRYLVCAAFLAGACAETECNGEEPSGNRNAPRIEGFRLVGQPIEDDPWTLSFDVAFIDEDADLSQGEIFFFLNNNPSSSSQSMSTIFLQSGVPTSATSGRLGFALRFVENVADGAIVKLGVQLVDGANRRSNCASLDLEFDVSRVTTVASGES